MRAAVTAPGESGAGEFISGGFVVDDRPDPIPGPGELVLRVAANGICGSDLSTAPLLPSGTIMGHEFAGEVVGVGPEDPDVPHSFRVGDPVAAWLQVTSSTEATSNGVAVLVTATRLYLRAGTVGGVALAADDVVEVDGRRYAVDGAPHAPVNTRGRARFLQANLKSVSHG